VQRHKWRRQAGNDGKARALVPPDMLRPERVKLTDVTGNPAGNVTGNEHIQAGAIAALEDAVAGLREQLDVANARAERAEADRADERLRADAAIAGERSRADAALAVADRTLTQLADAQGRITDLQRDLDAARAAQKAHETAEEGREGERARADALRDRLNAMQEQLADAHAALQAAESANARAVQAEQDKERAETAITGERQRADALRDRLDGMQHDLDAARERMQFSQAALDQAQAEARKARDAAEALRQAEADRKARGVLARLRDAWRGR
jgi:chromosome segregation ATPase